MKRLLTIAALGLPMLYQVPALATDAENLKVKLAEIKSLKADFSQTVTDLNNKVIQTGEGVFALSQPNQFYWHLTAPDESLIVADGTDVWVYNPFAEEVSVMDINQAINASPIALLVHSDDATWSQYNVKQKDNCFDISPKDTDSGVSEVQVCFNQTSLTQMVLTDQQGNISDFRLSNQNKIAENDRDLFKFVVPDDVDIDDQRLKLTN
ncbi:MULTISPECIES: outer membrane lipoprotein chaperone LolA [Shewanella]|uniref:Outer-membrane lipoprotein carrier protein n=1 Tax=Shewanella fidelis TaxID=173509 RepID=A0AAW8NMY3_9GAMM|nr:MULTISPECIES: outer membrane lipoprotein chaperone LolA [Shewanella]MDR8523881.1 outer membrane lipoprotein chaperone LolA [Shewanella fidelis]MDW4810428.1 outer membrane lipoprotein chaperone LolA [Shewanella fidelis]MDW4814549.1 outer membrane lipoprotein chaperone LolA [Shewanella fidelis]MDW4818639.1 outer membrane lipoprotein chaperone LolA [Shewanella fidelis]MDW4823684.1 outer membrane lipoprotein chaperone LolA [Shewanella fidelis]